MKDQKYENNKISNVQNYESTIVKSGGPIFTIAGRAGYRVPCIDALFYLKFGAGMRKTEFECGYFNEQVKSESKDKCFSNSRVFPFIGMAIEKNVFKGCNLNFGVDYYFATNKSWEYKGLGKIDENFTKLKNKNKGWAAHLAAVHYF